MSEALATAQVKKKGPAFFDEIRRIESTVGLTAENVERAARNPANPLHPFFTWDDARSAYLHRLQEARELICCIVERDEDILEGKPFRAYLNSRTGFEANSQYRPVRVVLSNKKFREAMLRSALSQAEAWQRRYQILEELSLVFSAIKTTRKTIAKPKGPKK